MAKTIKGWEKKEAIIVKDAYLIGRRIVEQHKDWIEEPDWIIASFTDISRRFFSSTFKIPRMS
jgi:hypothetical protein